ncbi:PAS domain-containing protein [Pyxidicoccus sp. 3LFB2]
MTPPFDKLFNLSANPYMVLDRDLRYVAANDAYLQVTASKREDLLGRRVFDLFPNDPADPANAPAQMLRDSFERVLRERRQDVLALIPYRVPRHTPEGVVEEERFWSATHTPLLDEQGQVAFILQHTVDVTELQRLRQAVQTPEGERDTPAPVAHTHMEAGVLHRARAVQEAYQTLDSERRHLLRLFEQAPSFMAVLRGPTHVFELANAAYYQLVGHRSLVGLPVRQVLPELAGQGFFELLDRVYATGQPFIGRGMKVLVQRRKEAPVEEAFLDFVYQPLLGADGRIVGIFAQGHDITEQMQAQNALRESEERLRRVVEASGAGTWQMDLGTGRVSADPRLLILFGLPPEGELTLEAILSGIHPEDRARVEHAVRSALAGEDDGHYYAEYRTLGPGDGRERWVEGRGQVYFDANGKPVRFMGTGLDITLRKVAEDEVRRLNRDLERRVQERTQELREANKELEAFSYSVSHDLRAPLRHITGFAQLLDKRAASVLDDKGRGYVRTISEAAQKGGQLVDDLLAFSRLGRAELKRVPVDLSQLVEEVKRELAPECEGRQVTWRVGRLPAVQGDASLLRVAFKNLLSNALKYSRPRREALIEVTAEERGGEVQVQVRDNGVGFDMQYVDKLFGVFQRLHTVEQFEGTGIGLANVRRIVHRHGGRISARGQLDEGATFQFTLPRTAGTENLS